ncbi:MAG: TetR/AcrR family transcriptional regulator [Bdellovibrionales bacterium]
MRTRSALKQLKKAPRRSAPASTGDGSARQQLLGAARTLFARKGLSGTSIRDIAQKAQLNSSLISYYFTSKEGLYRTCVEEIASASLQMAQNVLQPARSEAEYRLRLEMFLNNIFQLYLEDRDTGLILIREYDRRDSPAEDIFRDSFLKILNHLVLFFKSAQEIRLLDREKDPLTLAGLLVGCVTSQMRMDHLQERAYGKSLRDPGEKRKVENHIVDLFTIPPKNKR